MAGENLFKKNVGIVWMHYIHISYSFLSDSHSRSLLQQQEGSSYSWSEEQPIHVEQSEICYHPTGWCTCILFICIYQLRKARQSVILDNSLNISAKLDLKLTQNPPLSQRYCKYLKPLFDSTFRVKMRLCSIFLYQLLLQILWSSSKTSTKTYRLQLKLCSALDAVPQFR